MNALNCLPTYLPVYHQYVPVGSKHLFALYRKFPPRYKFDSVAIFMNLELLCTFSVMQRQMGLFPPWFGLVSIVWEHICENLLVIH